MPAEIVTVDKENNKVGRPCKYESHVQPYLDKVFEWLKHGYTDISICEQLGISQDSFIKYKEEYTDLSNLYACARKERNALVMNKMYERACGYEHPDLFIAQHQGIIVEKEIKKYYPPDVNAADLFLRNNDPDYKQAKQVESGQNITVNFQLPEKIKEIEQLDKTISDLEKRLAVDVEAIPVD